MYFRGKNSLARKDRIEFVNRHSFYANSNNSSLAKVRAWRNKIFFVIVILFILTAIYLFFLSVIFSIKIQSITPTKYVPTETVLTRVREYLDKKQFILFKHNNYFIFSASELEQKLINDFLFVEVEVIKSWPNQISISVVEDESFVLFAPSPDSEKFLLLDYQGNLINTLSLDEAPPDLPKLFFQTNSEILADDDIPPSVFDVVIGSWAVARQTNSFHITQYQLKNDEVTAFTAEGFVILFTLKNDLGQQISNLKIMLADFQKKNIMPAEYLNLTLAEKVFYK